MEQNIDNRHKEILWDLLANPAENGQLYKHNLERLVQDNPQSGLLQVMYARSQKTPDVRKAAAYFSPKALHKIMHDPDGLLPVSRDRINKALNGSHSAEPENYFNIGAVAEVEAEAPELINDAPVAEEESLIPQELTQPVDNFALTKESTTVIDEKHLLPALEEEKTFTEPIQEYMAEPAQEEPGQSEPVQTKIAQEAETEINASSRVEESEAEVSAAEETHEELLPVITQEAYATSVETSPAVPLYQPAATDEDDDEFANPWDFSRLDEKEPEEIAVSEAETDETPLPAVEKAKPILENEPEPQTEPLVKPAEVKVPEPVAEIAHEPQPNPVIELVEEESQKPAPVAEPITEEPKIETYDHSLSAFEELAIKQADEEPQTEAAEVSSFESYRPENVFHKQDNIEDEVYNEIVSIDEIGVQSISNTFAEDTVSEESHVEAVDATEEAAAAQQALIADETEKLIYGNIAATDYLSFDKKLDELRAGIADAQPAAEQQPQPVTQQFAPLHETPVAAAPQAISQIPITAVPETQLQTQAPVAETVNEPVSKYNDATLPYSFLWWLDKTRKEYAGSTQPYARAEQTPSAQQPIANDVKKAPQDDLQQQYYANIFSLTSVSSIGEIEPPQIAFDHTKKEDIIIERFIHTDPQIKPLAADKLDTENKARKSSEDQDAMVSETLARIYGDQMLYHKAIATYKKLMLKIPEKKLYFAAQIEQLEKKIN